jgi:hypothetical protein
MLLEKPTYTIKEAMTKTLETHNLIIKHLNNTYLSALESS